jgi:hypothetical protein
LKRVEAAIEPKRWDEAYRASEAIAAADTAYAKAIANQGFDYIAMSILDSNAPSPEAKAIARRAAERAL